MILAEFSAPGNMTELSEDSQHAWHERVSSIFSAVSGRFPRLYNPTTDDTPDDRRVLPVPWSAFPGPLLSSRVSPESRWGAADASRDVQDEYCEWSVLRDSDEAILRVTFTSETPEYYDHLFDTQPELLLDLYEQALGHPVSVDALRGAGGFYNSRNQFNLSTTGPIVHLAHRNNFLRAAVELAGAATILREDDNGPVSHPQALVECGDLGEPARHSDPQIAAAVNNLVSNGFDVTLADPPGLYLAGLETTGMETRDNSDAKDFWRIERGDQDHVVRASFEVPDDRDYQVSDIRIGGRPIDFGAQLADRVQVKVTAIAKAGDPPPDRQPCIRDPGE